MSANPSVSVVMGVYNEAQRVERTVRSVLDQSHRDLELVVVDDGSTDETQGLLDALAAADRRMRVFRQNNGGLTQALINGCGEARGTFIARQDAGDVSHPARLSTQLDLMIASPATALTACGARFVGPENEVLYEISRPGVSLQNGLDQLSLAKLEGPPAHGACMFRRDAYLQAGGYRMPFRVAQDIDLWLRLAEIGPCVGSPEFLYDASVDCGGISHLNGDAQRQMGSLAIQCALMRRSGGAEVEILSNFHLPVRKNERNRVTSRNIASFHYFVGNCLRERDAPAARRYFRRALRENPLHLGALFNLLRSWT